MVKDIITYPSTPSLQYATDVRLFNDDIFSIIQDIKDTIEANVLDGLAAFQIGSYYNIVVVKQDDGSFLELINPRLIKREGKVTTVEKTAYYPGLSAEVTRYKSISLVYEDRDGTQHSMKADGSLSILLQRKIDYTFGSSFIDKLSKDQKKLFETKLEFGMDIEAAEYCSTTFKRDYIVKVINIIMIAMTILLLSYFFVDENIAKTIFDYQLYLYYGAIGLNIVYFFYAQHEGKKFTSCTSCQLGNIIGTVLLSLVYLSLLMILSYFII